MRLCTGTYATYIGTDDEIARWARHDADPCQMRSAIREHDINPPSVGIMLVRT